MENDWTDEFAEQAIEWIEWKPLCGCEGKCFAAELGWVYHAEDDEPYRFEQILKLTVHGESRFVLIDDLAYQMRDPDDFSPHIAFLETCDDWHATKAAAISAWIYEAEQANTPRSRHWLPVGRQDLANVIAGIPLCPSPPNSQSDHTHSSDSTDGA